MVNKIEPTRSLKEYVLETGYTSKEVALKDIDLSTFVARDFKINIPLISAPMQAVASPVLLAELARCGGLGVAHCSQSIEKQAEVIRQVKNSYVNAGMYQYPLKPLTDSKGNLMVGAAINTIDYEQRAPELAQAGTGIFIVESSHGNTEFQQETLESLEKQYPHIRKIGGNVMTKQGADNLIKWGADGKKAGMGIASICITTEVKATGKGQATTIEECATPGNYDIPLIADGGIETSKDMCIALALGADALMMGRYFARFEESPGRKLSREDLLKENPGLEGRLDPKIKFFKEYWGEGSLKARQIAVEAGYRYGQSAFEEGVSGYIEYVGSLKEGVERTLLKIIKAIKDTGFGSLEDFKKNGNGKLRLISSAALADSRPHDLIYFEKTDFM